MSGAAASSASPSQSLQSIPFAGVWRDNLGRKVTFSVESVGAPGETLEGAWNGGTCEGTIEVSQGWGLRATGAYSEIATDPGDGHLRSSAVMSLGRFDITLDPMNCTITGHTVTGQNGQPRPWTLISQQADQTITVDQAPNGGCEGCSKCHVM